LSISDFLITHLKIDSFSHFFVINNLFSELHLSVFFSDLISSHSQKYFQFITFLNHNNEYIFISFQKLIIIFFVGFKKFSLEKLVLIIFNSGTSFSNISYLS
jgi:hypothetical protein